MRILPIILLLCGPHTPNNFLARAIKLTIHGDASPVPYGEVLRLWQTGLPRVLSEAPRGRPVCRVSWETPPITARTAQRAFEFVLLDSPGLARQPDAEAFAEHFTGASAEGVVEFANLGGDAVMVVPCPSGPLGAYGNIAAFVRQAPQAQRHALWQRVGAAMERRLGAKPVWLSTAGAGVAWLHVRLDNRPKYYGHTANRDEN